MKMKISGPTRSALKGYCGEIVEKLLYLSLGCKSRWRFVKMPCICPTSEVYQTYFVFVPYIIRLYLVVLSTIGTTPIQEFCLFWGSLALF
jgi:hypothetical protein